MMQGNRFLTPDDHILLMIDQDGGQYSLDDLKCLHDAGIQTVLRYVIWRDIEKEPLHFNWDIVERWLTDDRKAGLKTLLSVYDLAPAFFPDEWYMQSLDDQRFTGSFYANLLAPWVADAWERHRDFIALTCSAFNASDVLCFRGTMHGGECLLPDFAPVKLPPGLDPIEQVIRLMVDEQKIFYLSHPSREIFTSLHHAFDPVPYTENCHTGEVLAALSGALPYARRYQIVYTQYAPVNGTAQHVADAKVFPTYCGSEFCEGLLVNTDRAIREGFRGFVTAPLHALTTHRQLQPWMLDAIRYSLDRWQNAVHPA